MSQDMRRIAEQILGLSNYATDFITTEQLFRLVKNSQSLARAYLALLEKNALLVKALEQTKDSVELDECRADEDCDHCYRVYQVINPALEKARAVK